MHEIIHIYKFLIKNWIYSLIINFKILTLFLYLFKYNNLDIIKKRRILGIKNNNIILQIEVK